MNRFKWIIMLGAILVFTNSTIIYGESYIDLEKNAREEGYSLGYIDGYMDGLKDLSNGSKSSSYLTKPEKTDILTKYKSNLLDKDNIYKGYFFLGYIEGYEIGYKEIFDNSSLNTEKIDTKINYGDVLGRVFGEIYGFRDFYGGKNSNWLKAIPSNTEIIKLFDLGKQTGMYKSSFLSLFRESFKGGYEEGYEKANLDPKKISLESGIKDGESIGSILGKIYGSKDFFENKNINNKRDLPSDRNIINKYSLNQDYKQYSEGFLIGFKRAYKEAYDKTYREININNHIIDISNAYEHGRNAGFNRGEILANKDFTENKENNWNNHRFLSSTIIAEYDLIYQSPEYRQGFVSGYWSGFAEGYSSTYLSLSQSQIGNKSSILRIPLKGGTLSSKDGYISVSINPGTYYNDVVLSIENLSDNKFKIHNSRFIKSSNLYNIQIANRSQDFNNDELIDISLEYYGNSNGGIYKRVGDKWIYLNSFIEDGKILTKVKPNTLANKENIFCVLIDKDLPLLRDIRDYWAKDEINALVRRDIIFGYKDNTFKPEREISRAEFLILLSRNYNWMLSDNISNIDKFKDFKDFGLYEKVISYGISAGYIKGYDDSTFRPHDSISYKEVEIIMSRVLKDHEFKWYNTSAKMLYEKQFKSNSYNSMNNKISRGEVSYMLYILNEWRY